LKENNQKQTHKNDFNNFYRKIIKI
jgi:hypothetical protein